MTFTQTVFAFCAAYIVFALVGYGSLFAASKHSKSTAGFVLLALGVICLAGLATGLYIDWKATLITLTLGLVYELTVVMTGMHKRLLPRVFA